MIVSFDDAQLRSLALQGDAAAARLGDVVAIRLHALIAEIEAAETAAELMELYGDEIVAAGDSLSIPLGPGTFAGFMVVRERGAFDAAGLPVWPGVRRLKLARVEVDGRGV